jgi:single-strand DNA-binding protein
MSISYNKVILVGRLTADPEITFAQNGTQISKFTLAVDRQYQKDKQQEADFLRIISFGKLAEFTRDYLRKGILIMAEGRIQTSRFQGQDGVTKYYTDIIAEKINFMETKKSQNKSPSLPEIPNNSPEPLEKDGDEVPF